MVKYIVMSCLVVSHLAGADGTVILENWRCCGSELDFQKVALFLKERVGALTEEYYSIRITPSISKIGDGLATSSHESVAFCFAVATRLRAVESHAYLFKTPLGISLHHWNAKSKRYQKRTLSGTDVYDRRFMAGRVAWIGDYLGSLPKLWLVSDEVLITEEAASFAKEVMSALGLRAAVAYIRTDPYYWPPDSCSPYSLPLQWRREMPQDVSTISRETISCKINIAQNVEKCVVYKTK
jgi:hypothetical protein